MPTPTVFSLLLNLCGLKQREAADILGVSLDTVKSWSTGKQGRAPEWAIKTLREFYYDAECWASLGESEVPMPVENDPKGRLIAALVLAKKTDYPELLVFDQTAPKEYINLEAI